MDGASVVSAEGSAIAAPPAENRPPSQCSPPGAASMPRLASAPAKKTGHKMDDSRKIERVSKCPTPSVMVPSRGRFPDAPQLPTRQNYKANIGVEEVTNAHAGIPITHVTQRSNANAFAHRPAKQPA
jgi:hypothetical protein